MMTEQAEGGAVTDGPAAINLEVEQRGDATVVRPHGSIDDVAAHHLGEALMAQMDQGARSLVVDMSDVSFVTSSCLGAFMMAHKRVKKCGGGLRIANAQPLVREVLQITKLSRLFGVYDSVEQAINAR